MKIIFISASAILMFIASTVASSCNGGASLAGMILAADTSNPSKNVEKYGEIISKELKADNITGLDIGGCANIVYIQDSKTSVKMETNEKAFDLYNIKVEGSTLSVQQKKLTNNVPKISITVTSPAINNISCSGAGDITLGNVELTNDGMEIDISGAGEIKADNIKCDKDVTMHISGAGNIKAGEIVCAENVYMGISGAGNINGNVKCKNLDIKISGAGNTDMKIDCDNTSVSMSGAGSVELSGRTGTLKKNKGNMMCTFETDDLTVGK